MTKSRRRGSFLRIAGWAVAAAAVAQQLRMPPEERTWHGRVAGIVPYDFRPPTFDRIRSSWWSPEDERIITEQVFGVGWAVNLGRVARLLREELASG